MTRNSIIFFLILQSSFRVKKIILNCKKNYFVCAVGQEEVSIYSILIDKTKLSSILILTEILIIKAAHDKKVICQKRPNDNSSEIFTIINYSNYADNLYTMSFSITNYLTLSLVLNEESYLPVGWTKKNLMQYARIFFVSLRCFSLECRRACVAALTFTWKILAVVSKNKNSCLVFATPKFELAVERQRNGR